MVRETVQSDGDGHRSLAILYCRGYFLSVLALSVLRGEKSPGQQTGERRSCRGAKNRPATIDPPDALLRPFEVFLDLLGRLHAIGEVGSRRRQTSLRLGLQGEEFAMFGV